MMKKTHIHKVRLTEQQAASLKVLKSYNVNVGNFIREAIREKLHRDWKSIKERKSTNHCPF
jgi:hypothetical protein